MKKIMISSLTLFLVIGGFLFMNRGVDKEYEEDVREKIVNYINNKYGKENIVSVKSAYDDKHREKDKRYKIAAKINGEGLRDDEYMVFRLNDGKVIEVGVTTALPKVD
ncbi:hypothetical protein [Exiguobacterium sp. s193]|uniref:hypothetical protein n=1 Tax=Exiguobacterium sp. s193 TaxID=2751207 RepID=UPI001BE880A4|nr:hypothetical protein [Exiguobacterium sp. s193]